MTPQSPNNSEKGEEPKMEIIHGPIIIGGMDGFCSKCRDYKTLVEKYVCKDCYASK